MNMYVTICLHLISIKSTQSITLLLDAVFKQIYVFLKVSQGLAVKTYFIIFSLSRSFIQIYFK